MQILTQHTEITQACQEWRRQGQRIALVPTMGYYHAGHAALMREAKARNDRVVVSLFVNPTQFGPGEDLASYPRDLERDTAIAAETGADILFTPNSADMYAADHATFVRVPALSAPMCGISRPTHFEGVCTVVLKLLMITEAHMAFFGEKDWQQLAIIRRMVRDLNMGVDVRGIPIVREDDGLALSSRNVYLTPEERAQAPQIHKALCRARDMARQGEKSVALVQQMVLRRWAEKLPLGRLDYLSVVDASSLEAVHEIGENTLMACAVRMGKARLLDNILL